MRIYRAGFTVGVTFELHTRIGYRKPLKEESRERVRKFHIPHLKDAGARRQGQETTWLSRSLFQPDVKERISIVRRRNHNASAKMERSCSLPWHGKHISILYASGAMKIYCTNVFFALNDLAVSPVDQLFLKK